MPTRLHNYTQAWLDEECLDMLVAGYLTFPQAKVLIPNVGTEPFLHPVLVLLA